MLFSKSGFANELKNRAAKRKNISLITLDEMFFDEE